MTQTIIEVGEKFHIIKGRQFKEDIRRHFAGVVTAVSSGLIRAEGYSFVATLSGFEFRRLPGLRVRVFGISDGSYTLNILPQDIEIDRLSYNARTGALILTDGARFIFEVNEYK